jgi:hypothetical protein
MFIFFVKNKGEKAYDLQDQGLLFLIFLRQIRPILAAKVFLLSKMLFFLNIEIFGDKIANTC